MATYVSVYCFVLAYRFAVGSPYRTRAPVIVDPLLATASASAVSICDLLTASVVNVPVARLVIFFEFRLTSALGAVIEFNATVF